MFRNIIFARCYDSKVVAEPSRVCPTSLAASSSIDQLISDSKRARLSRLKKCKFSDIKEPLLPYMTDYLLCPWGCWHIRREFHSQFRPNGLYACLRNVENLKIISQTFFDLNELPIWMELMSCRFLCRLSSFTVPIRHIETTIFDPGSMFLSTHRWSQKPSLSGQHCFYKPSRNCHPSQRVSTTPRDCHTVGSRGAPPFSPSLGR